jgi:hypothetical protein
MGKMNQALQNSTELYTTYTFVVFTQPPSPWNQGPVGIKERRCCKALVVD